MRGIVCRIVVAASLLLLFTGERAGGSAFATSGFSNKSFKGSYAVGFSGTDLTVGPIAGTGILIADGKGNLTGTETIKDGPIVCTESFSGTYGINPDGTGTGSVTVTSTPDGGICASSIGNVITFSLVLSGNGSSNQIKLSETNPNYVILGSGERQ
ncbi:MAG: hypothetical protein Q7S58_05915 [Candidatus Binatus sp.]|uniref:hypothetical protein n=1 Tax=Candidatus Binatus sp. TaxID=2811406 RepID=UPI0027274FC2|nr:hypothetical protein [Candidatus Binatus sp.]MDO8431932.1 hypothetical protein [Candidatus Binatus sp.]